MVAPCWLFLCNLYYDSRTSILQTRLYHYFFFNSRMKFPIVSQLNHRILYLMIDFNIAGRIENYPIHLEFNSQNFSFPLGFFQQNCIRFSFRPCFILIYALGKSSTLSFRSWFQQSQLHPHKVPLSQGQKIFCCTEASFFHFRHISTSSRQVYVNSH